MLDIIIFAAFAAFIAFKLFKVLGSSEFEDAVKKDGNVVAFPNGAAEAVDVEFTEVIDDYDEMKEKYGQTIAEKIKQMRKYDPSFNDKSFLQGAKGAFEIIVKAFAKGDKNSLKPLLDGGVYKRFSDAIDSRGKSGNSEETTLVSILSSNIKDIILNKKYAKVVVEIVSEQITLIKNKQGEIVKGDPSKVDKISEVWTFSRNLTSKDPNWELVETGS